MGEPGLSTITAIEDNHVLEYHFLAFKALVQAYPDIAAFCIGYMERHWIIEKERVEIAFRDDAAMQRHLDFVRKEPDLHKRLKQHHIAACRLRRKIAFGRLGEQ